MPLSDLGLLVSQVSLILRLKLVHVENVNHGQHQVPLPEINGQLFRVISEILLAHGSGYL